MVQLVKRASDVRITEINLSQVLVSSSTTVACLPIISAQGSTKPLLFNDPNVYTAEYGNPNPAVSMSVQSGLNYFTEGRTLWGLRVVGAGAKYATLLMYNDSDGVTQFQAQALDDPTTVDMSTLIGGTAKAIALFYPSRGPGSYGDDYSLSVSTTALLVPAPAVIASASVGTLADGTYSYIVSALALTGETLGSTAATITRTGLGSSNGANLVSWALVPGAVGYRVYGRAAGTEALLATVGATVTSLDDTGALTPDTAITPVTDPLLAYSSKVFTVNVYDNTTQNVALESWQCTLTPAKDAAGNQLELTQRINTFSSQIRAVSNVAMLSSVPTVSAVAKEAMTGGASGTPPTSTQVVQALQAFLNSQLYRTNTFINAGMSDVVLQKALDTLVATRGDAVSLLDMPSGSQTVQASADYRNLELNLNSSYSALFGPDLLQADEVNGQQVYNPPSGWVAALCARTDRVAGPAFSIAGLNRGLVPVLKQRYSYNDPEATVLFNSQVNYFRTFTGQGIALWEQQTLSADYTALSWLSVRRNVNVIKVSAYQFLLYALQEMPVDSVRRQLVNGLGAYLLSVKNADGLSDYTVVCDTSNNPTSAANAGILVVTVILIPTIPIHEIQLQIVISKQGVTFSETLRSITGNTQ